MATDNLTGHVMSGTIGRAPVSLVNTVDTAVDNKAQNDVDQLFDVFPGDRVLAVDAKVETAEGGTLTFDVGDGSDVDGYIDGANGNSTGWNTNVLTATASTGATPTITMTGYNAGKIYTATDTIDVKWLNAADAAKVRFRVTIVRAGE